MDITKQKKTNHIASIWYKNKATYHNSHYLRQNNNHRRYLLHR